MRWESYFTPTFFHTINSNNDLYSPSVEIVIRHEIRVFTYNARHKHPRKSDFTHNELNTPTDMPKQSNADFQCQCICIYVYGFARGIDDFPEIVTIGVPSAVQRYRIYKLRVKVYFNRHATKKKKKSSCQTL